MCGIAGWSCEAGRQPPAQALTDMSQRLRHRGPDAEGIYTDANGELAFAHRRLSIIDLSAASNQPMVDDATGAVLLYNGELYNFRELRAQLQSLGHVFRTTGDSEVVLRGWLEWGPESLPRFAGMFAFALWDPRTQTLHLARDAMGMKPLYYVEGDGRFVFASELKAFAALPGFVPSADDDAVQQFMEFGYVFDERRTMLRGVHKLDPGTRLEVQAGRIAQRRAWFTPSVSDPHDTRGERERVEEFGEVMRKVVREHLIADVPLALLLSGGLDSSLVAALAAREGPLLTISMGFADSAVDERPHARAVAEHIGSRHIEVSITPAEVEREVAAGAWVFDDLFADWGTVTTRLLYRRCREEGVKVVLVGEGSDEIFGGYDIFRLPPRLGLWQQFRLYQKYAGRRWGRQFGRFHGIMRDYLDATGGDSFAAVRLFESRRQLPNNYVMKVDKASMAESVEARAPYLDRRIAELAYRTPAQWLLRGGENKYLLRAFARTDRLLPDASSARPKFGGSVAASWMDESEGFRGFARTRLLVGRWRARLGPRDALVAVFQGKSEGAPFPGALSIYRNVAWRVLLLELWSEHYLPQ